MARILPAFLLLLLALVIDVAVSQSPILVVINATGIYTLLLWWNISGYSVETAWTACLGISLLFGIIRQQNLALMILSLSGSLVLIDLVRRIFPRAADNNWFPVLAFFNLQGLLLLVSGYRWEILSYVLFVGINSFLVLLAIALVDRNRARQSGAVYHYS